MLLAQASPVLDAVLPIPTATGAFTKVMRPVVGEVTLAQPVRAIKRMKATADLIIVAKRIGNGIILPIKIAPARAKAIGVTTILKGLSYHKQLW